MNYIEAEPDLSSYHKVRRRCSSVEVLHNGQDFVLLIDTDSASDLDSNRFSPVQSGSRV